MESISQEHGTPDVIFFPLHNEFNFTIDLCASKENALLPKYYTKGDDLLAVAIGSKDRLLLHGARSGLADATATTIFQTDATCTNNSRFSFIVHYEALVVDSVIAAYTQVQTGTVKVAGKVIGATSTAESIVDDSVQYVTADALAVTFSVAVASDILSFRVAMDTTGTPTNLTRSIKYSVWLFDQYILTVVSS
mgnify:CR=1 FL=1